ARRLPNTGHRHLLGGPERGGHGRPSRRGFDLVSGWPGSDALVRERPGRTRRGIVLPAVRRRQIRREKAGGRGPPTRGTPLRGFRLLLPVVFAFQMGFQRLDLVALLVVERGLVVFGHPLESEFETHWEELRGFRFRLPFKLGNRGFNRSIFPKGVLAQNEDQLV